MISQKRAFVGVGVLCISSMVACRGSASVVADNSGQVAPKPEPDKPKPFENLDHLADPIAFRAELNAELHFDAAVMLLSDVQPSSFVEPPRRTSKGDRLALDLTVDYANFERTYGEQQLKLRLRAYADEVSGPGLPGPTLVIDPRQLSKKQQHVTLAVHLCNKLETDKCDEPASEGDHSAHAEHGGNASDPENFQANDTNLHTHGLHVSPSGNSDNVFILAKPGQFFDYEIEVPKDHPPGTFWYHAHNHGSTATQLGNGMAGALLVAGGLDDAKGIKGRTDRVFLFQQVQWDNCKGATTTTNPYEQQSDGTYKCVGTIEDDNFVDWWQGAGANKKVYMRPTLVNGQLKPSFTMKSNEVQRWRFLHAGVDQSLNLVLCPEGDAVCEKDGTGGVPLNRIAIDGLATGKIQPMPRILMGPGYRRDVLVQAPACAQDACVYNLIDTVTTPTQSLHGTAEQGQILATITVGKDKVKQSLPTDEDLRKYAFTQNVDPNPNEETMIYSPTVAQLTPWCEAGNEVACQAKQAVQVCIPERTADCPDPVMRRAYYNINGQRFDPAVVRTLTLGTSSRWTLSAGNWGPHPFHIHVNPFQLVSVSCEGGADPLLDVGLDQNLWRDTLLVQMGCTYEVLTTYEEFTGKFVQHCHILPHEDQGMMEVIDIVAAPAPTPAPAG